MSTPLAIPVRDKDIVIAGAKPPDGKTSRAQKRRQFGRGNHDSRGNDGSPQQPIPMAVGTFTEADFGVQERQSRG